MKEDYRILKFSPGDVFPLASLAAAEYPGGEMTNPVYLRWQYEENPAGPAVITTAHGSAGSLAAQYAVIPLRFSLNDKEIAGSLSLNTLTHPGHRGKGLFRLTALSTYALCEDRRILFTIGVPNGNSFPGFISGLDFTNAGEMKLLAQLLRPAKAAMKFLFPGAKKGESILLNTEGMLHENVSVLDLENDKNAYAGFLKKWENQKVIALHRSAAYLSWRYLNHPTRRYILLKETAGQEIKGIAVIRAMHLFGMRAGLLIDYCSLDETGNLPRAVRHIFRKHGLDIILTLSTGFGKEYRSLRSSGFYNVPRFLLPQRFPFIVKNHKGGEENKQLYKMENWHFTFGDYDVF